MSKAFVLDSLAEAGTTRRHEVLVRMAKGNIPAVIKTYELDSETPKEMEIDHAMQFLKDAAFIVSDEKGERILPVPVNKDGGIGSLVLNRDEVIANLSELTKGALYKRCKVLPGSDALTEKSTIQNYIEFLVEKAKPLVRNRSDVEDALSLAGEGLSDAEFEKMGL